MTFVDTYSTVGLRLPTESRNGVPTEEGRKKSHATERDLQRDTFVFPIKKRLRRVSFEVGIVTGDRGGGQGLGYMFSRRSDVGCVLKWWKMLDGRRARRDVLLPG